MRATIKNYLDAAKQRREETGQAGFSLIELIVVVAILGVLVAVAIPVFGAIQDNAKANSIKTAAANGATVVAAEIARGVNPLAQLKDSETADYTYSMIPANGEGATLNNFCVTANGAGALSGSASSGPACTTTP